VAAGYEAKLEAQMATVRAAGRGNIQAVVRYGNKVVNDGEVVGRLVCRERGFEKAEAGFPLTGLQLKAAAARRKQRLSLSREENLQAN
jgi:hypothetical protein